VRKLNAMFTPAIAFPFPIHTYRVHTVVYSSCTVPMGIMLLPEPSLRAGCLIKAKSLFHDGRTVLPQLQHTVLGMLVHITNKYYLSYLIIVIILLPHRNTDPKRAK